MNRTSPLADVQQMYDDTADHYAAMMAEEIKLPVYAETLTRLFDRIGQGPVMDVACGSGDMLQMIHEQYDPERRLIGVDLSPRMVAITSQKLGAAGQAVVGDMGELSGTPNGSVAVVINFFAVHHLDPDQVQLALKEWSRVLAPGGQLLLAAWEGEGEIDYGEHADLVAFRYQADALSGWASAAGLSVLRCVVESVDGFPMDAVYLEAGKP